MSARPLALAFTLVQPTAQDPAAEAPPADGRARDLCAAMAAGDRRALAELFALRSALVEREAAQALGHRTDLLADAVQEAWLRVARTSAPCRNGAALDAWLRRVAAGAALDLLRAELARRARERVFARSHPEARAFLDDAAQLERAHALLAQLSADDRALLELRARTGATLAQLGAALGLGAAAVDSRLRRAVARARLAAGDVAGTELP